MLDDSPGPVPYRPTPLEVAAGWVYGHDPVLPRGAGGATPAAALRAAVTPQVTSGAPIAVAFSGGRDSSAVLAVVADVAREMGAPAPVALTRVYPGVPAADESAWQTEVLSHVGVEEWVRIPITDELDVLGPYALPLVEELGHPLWPPAAHSLLPLLEQLAPGTVLLTGEGGDEVLGPARTSPLRRLAARRLPPGRTSLRLLGSTAGPRAMRRRLLRASLEQRRIPWLTDEGWEAVADLELAELLEEPFDWGASTRRQLARRAWTGGSRTLAWIAARHGVELAHPLATAAVVDAVAGATGRLGPVGRADATRLVTGGLLPDAVLQRTTKSAFTGTVLGPSTRALLDEVDAADTQLPHVDVPTLLSCLRGKPHAASLGLVQALWLATRR